MKQKLFLMVLSLLWMGPMQGATYEHYSEWMAYSEMSRVQHSYNLDNQFFYKKWTYVIGIELESILDTYLTYGDSKMLSYAREYPDNLINAYGKIDTYKLEDYNVDNLRPAMLALRLNDLHSAEKYEKALATFYSQLDTHPRTSDGIFWHKKVYHDQVWLDGLYMAQPFYTAYAQRHETNPTDVYDDSVEQLLLAADHTYDPLTELWRHGYDESRTLFWADKTTGLSEHCWGRALGWMSMAIIELLDILPADYEGRQDVIDLLNQVMKSVINRQDPEKGVWRLVLDVEDDDRNYFEATCSCMFAYALLKGHRLGYLDDSFQEAGIRAYKGIINTFISKDNKGLISLNNCCSVGGLGPENKPQRDGSFEYYISEAKSTNDGKGIGPFIWASLEMERLGYTTNSDYTLGISSPVNGGTKQAARQRYDLKGQRAEESLRGVIIDRSTGRKYFSR
ncbi:MAG: glycoside hydrolase family 88 protein [Prevotella sp.]|nr:glycoside hydrolase family 88 protein [Prevotella sp.]